MQLIIFYVFAAVLLFAGAMVVSSRNPVHAAMVLVLAFFNGAALWLLAEAEFLGVALVLVYVGAVMVLFLFVVMMLDINVSSMRQGFARYLPIGIAVAAVMVLEMILVLGSDQINVVAATAGGETAVGSNIRAIGSVLYTVYLYPFELAAMILLLAIIAAILLTHRRRGGTKHQDPTAQAKVRAEDRVRLVQMQAVQRRQPSNNEAGAKE